MKLIPQNFKCFDRELKAFIEPKYEKYFTSDFFEFYNIDNNDNDVTSKMLRIIKKIQNLIYLAYLMRKHRPNIFKNVPNERYLQLSISKLEETFQPNSYEEHSLYTKTRSKSKTDFWIRKKL